MSTYPRLPFRPIPLTLTLRKPIHPPPISIISPPVTFPISSPSSSLFSSSNNKMSLSSLLSPLPMLTTLPNPPSSPFSLSSTLPPTPSLSPCPPPRQFRGAGEHCDQGKQENKKQFQRYEQRLYVPQMVQEKKATAVMPVMNAFQNGGGGGSVKRRRPNQSIITPFKPPASPRFLVLSKKKKHSAAVVTAAVLAAEALTVSQEKEEEIDLEALTYYPPVYTPIKGTKTERGGGGGFELGYGSSKLERRRKKPKSQKRKRDRTQPEHPTLQQKHQVQRALYSDRNFPNKSYRALSQDNGQCTTNKNFSACDDPPNSNDNSQGYFSTPNSTATVLTIRPRSYNGGLPMPLKKRFMVKNSVL